MSPVQAVGKFYDGLSGGSHEVMVGITGSSIQIKAVDGSFEKRWSFNEVQVLEEASDPQPAKLSSQKEPDARLLINPDTGWLRIRDRLPKDALPKMNLPISWKSFIGYTGLAVAILLIFFSAGPAILEQGYRFIPQSTEQALGKYVMKQVVTQPVCVAKDGQAALDKMLTRLQGGAEREIDYKLYVMEEDDMLNAFAAPGGYLVLLSSVIKEAESPEEIAGVLAHEMAHIELYHPTRGLARDAGFGILLAMMTGSADTARLAGTLNTLQYSRADEEDADRIGQSIMEEANINPHKMALFFEKLLETEHDHADENDKGEKDEEASAATTTSRKWSTYFSTHPATGNRIEMIKAHPTTNKDFKPILNTQEWQDLKEICSATQDF